MQTRTRLSSGRRYKSVWTSIGISLSLLISLCGPFPARRVQAQLPQPGQPPTPSLPGKPPAPNLPNLDVLRNLPSAVPTPKPGGFGPLMQFCEDGPCTIRDGDPPPPPPPPRDPNYATPRTQPPNRTGEPGITLGSRNYNWSTSLVSLPGRSGMDLDVSLTYNSLVWVRENGVMKFNADQGFPGPGFRLGLPVIQTKYQNSQTGLWSYLMITPSGGRVDLRQVGASNIYEAADGSYTQLTENSFSSLTVRSGDGTQLMFAAVFDANNTLTGYVCTLIKDRNGNFISAAYNGNLLTGITDTAGRGFNFNYDANGFLLSITQNGVVRPWATFTYNGVVFSYNFPGLAVDAPPNNSVINVLTQVNLSDNSSYQFSYNTWGQVTQISRFAPDAHMLAYTSSNLPADSTTAQSDCPRFTEQHEWAQDWNVVNGQATEAITQLGVDADGGQVMITPDGTRFKELSFSSGWQAGLPYQDEVWSGGVRQKWTTFSWTQDNTAVGYPVNPRLIETTIGDDVNGSQRRTHIDYSTFTMPSGTSCSLPSDVTEYAADTVTPLRRTHTDYNLDAAYLIRNLVGLAGSSSVYDGGGTLFSRSDFHYDESALQAPGAIAHHDVNYNGGFVQGRGNVTSVTRFNVGNLAQSTTSSATYNTAGSAISATDPLGHSTTIVYWDSLGGNNGGTTLAYPTRITDADGNATTSQYDYNKGVLTQIQTPPSQGFTQGPIETRSYDDARRLMQVTNNVNGAYTRWAYDASGLVVQSFATIQNGAGEAYSVQVFDGAGRVRATASDHPGSTGLYSGQYTVFDIMGRVTQQSNPTEMNSQWIATGDDAVASWVYTLQAYDWKGRPTVTTNADGTQRTLTYDGCGCAGGEVATARDERGRQRRTRADVLGRLAKTEELNWDGSVYATANYSYDPLDHLSSISHEGQVRSFAYDGYGRVVSRTTPEQGTTTYSYFADDAVQTITDARGASATFTYNGRHLATAISYGVPAGVAATANASFGYDAACNRT
jgi:YD repeat-containing protein